MTTSWWWSSEGEGWRLEAGGGRPEGRRRGLPDERPLRGPPRERPVYRAPRTPYVAYVEYDETAATDPGENTLESTLDLVIHDGTPAIAFKNYVADAFEPSVMSWDGAAWSFVGGRAASTSNDDHLTLGAADGVLHLGLRDGDLDHDATGMRIGR